MLFAAVSFLFSCPVAVYDNVLLSQDGGYSDLFSSLSDITGGTGGTTHQLFDRQQSPTTSIETTLSELLSSLSDESRYVEYWWRSSWLNLDMHRDIDETHGKTLPPLPPFGDVEVSKDDFKYPAFGHVLYCGVEGDDELVVDGAGGTVLLSSSSNTTTQHPSTTLFVVPPRPGRLLRFKGDLMHGVPRPALSYFNSDEVEGGSNHLIFTKKAKDTAKRKVILFIT